MEEARRRPAKLKGPRGPGGWSYALELCPLRLPRKAGDWTLAWEREGCAGSGVEKAVPETSPTGTQGHWSPLSDVPSYSRQAGGCAEEVTLETAQARGLCPPLGLGPTVPGVQSCCGGVRSRKMLSCTSTALREGSSLNWGPGPRPSPSSAQAT